MPYPLPYRPFFSSGPCAKPKEWSLSGLSDYLLGRSHRAPEALAFIQEVMSKLRTLLHIPSSYKLVLTPASATGAVEMALWNFLGPKPVDILEWDVFSALWTRDIFQELKLEGRVLSAPPPLIFQEYNPAHDLVFAWCGTTQGIWVGSDYAWLEQPREGLAICDATSAVLTTEIPWELLDVTAFSWQKGLGGEAGTGILVLSPKAMDRLKTYTPSWPLPRVFRLKNSGHIIEGIFKGEVINTVSLLGMQEAFLILSIWEQRGGLEAAIARTQQNYALIKKWCQSQEWIDFLVPQEAYRAHGPICLVLPFLQGLPHHEQWAFLHEMDAFLVKHKAGFECLNHAHCATPSLRIWCGPTIEFEDLQALLPWLKEAYDQALKV